MKFIVHALIIFLLTGICSCYKPGYGFEEANFRLAEESRLPKWFKLPAGYERKDVSVKVDLYSCCLGNCARITLYGPPPKSRKLDRKKAIYYNHPHSEKQKWYVFPTYMVLQVDSISEVFEQRQPCDILYITDDSKLTSVIEQGNQPD